MAKKMVRFDWAMKKMLRHRASFAIQEGFLSEWRSTSQTSSHQQ
ncbi:hypothetical protein [Haliscomenobacter sp.]